MKAAAGQRKRLRSILARAAGASKFGIEQLEDRFLLSLTAKPAFIDFGPVAQRPADSPADLVIPAQIRSAYGVNLISFGGITGDGSGQTIAIVDAYNDPNIQADANAFSSNYGLPDFNVSGGPSLKVLNEYGGTTPPGTDPSGPGGWDVEEALDVEYAHTIAPNANIILFEASSNDDDLFIADATAADYTGVSVVSNSWGGGDGVGEQSFDSTFTTPAGHQGVTFLAATGDSGGEVLYPAASPNVVGVGGTSLTVNNDGSYNSESAWSGGGGGISVTEAQPSYQVGKVHALTTTLRATPDVALDADPNTGVPVLDTFYYNGYLQVGGTSLATPMWAALVAIVDQGRAIKLLGSLDGATQTLPALYKLSPSYFHDITTGNNGFPATPGYDLDTGIGTPIANLLVPALAGFPVEQSLSFAVQPPSSAVVGSNPSSFTVDLLDANGNIINDNSDVTVSIYDGPTGASLGGTLTVQAQSGIATFTGVDLPTTPGSYTMVATDSGYASVRSNVFTLTPAPPHMLAFIQQPSLTPIGTPIFPAIAVAVEDQYGNIEPGNALTVTLSISNGPSSGALGGVYSLNAYNGVATFNDVKLSAAGQYMLTAYDLGLNSATSASFTITPPTMVVFAQQPTGIIAGSTLNPVTLDVEDQYGNIVTGDNSAVTLTIGSGPVGAVLGGVTTVNAVNGVATFGSLSLNQLGTYTLRASDSTLSAAISSAFNVSGPASKVVFAQQPTETPVGASLNPSLTVYVEDAYGNIVSSNSSNVTLSILTGPNQGNIGGQLTVTAVNGIATFNYLWINEPGTYSIKATDPNLTSATSNSFVDYGSYTMKVVSAFSGGNGADPSGGLTTDTGGDIFGSTLDGGADGDGTIFEIKKGNNFTTTIASFNYTNGADPNGNLLLDGNGNIYGTTQLGGVFTEGSVFEINKGSSVINTLVSFNYSNGYQPMNGVVRDSAGDLFGTTEFGGSEGLGTVFEVVNGSGIATTLLSFNINNGAEPTSPVAIDSSGNLWGSVPYGDNDLAGGIFELTKPNFAFTLVNSFDGSIGEPEQDLLFDSKGNLFGNTSGGFIFEMPKGSTSINTISALPALTGPIVLDVSDDVFTTTLPGFFGGTSSFGGIYDIPAGTTNPLLLGTLGGGDGILPEGIAIDSSGNIWGTGEGGGSASFTPLNPGDGNVFELLAPHLVFTQQPTTTYSGQLISPSVTVSIETPFDSVITTDDSTINLSTAEAPVGSQISGTLTTPLVNGAANFTNLSAVAPGIYEIEATDPTYANVAALSNVFTIVAPTPPTLLTATSVMNEGGVSYAINLPLNLPGGSLPGIEDRSGGPQLIALKFKAPVVLGPGFAVSLQTAGGAPDGTLIRSAVSTLSSNELDISVSGAVNAQTLVITASNLQDTASGATGTYTVDVGVLLGDVGGHGIVNGTDFALFAASFGQPTSTANFTSDFLGIGAITGGDFAVFAHQFGSSLLSFAPATAQVAAIGGIPASSLQKSSGHPASTATEKVLHAVNIPNQSRPRKIR